MKYKELNLSFTVYYSDNEYFYSEDNKLVRFWKKLKWRISKSWIILTKGGLDINDVWTPVRTSEQENLFGYNETINLANYLIKSANEIKDYYDKIEEDKQLKE